MELKKRNCPICGVELNYKSNEAYSLAKRKNGNCRSCATKKYAKRIGDLSFLLKDENESFYWVGFLLADGSFDKFNRLKLVLSQKDRGHLELFSLKSKTIVKDTVSVLNGKQYQQCSISIMHREIVQKIMDKFDIKQNKTIYPPNVDKYKKFSREQLFSLFVGYIDGDGNIGKKHNREDSHIRIKVHQNWFEFVEFFNKQLDINAPLKITKCGYALLQISNYKVCREIKQETISLKIPFLKRKWELIKLK